MVHIYIKGITNKTIWVQNIHPNANTAFGEGSNMPSIELSQVSHVDTQTHVEVHYKTCSLMHFCESILCTEEKSYFEVYLYSFVKKYSLAKGKIWTNLHIIFSTDGM